ncbi:MAG: PIN domain-containing protein [Microcystaceae cyanobacterium]
MKVYIETNFVLELAFQQEEFSSCESIVDLCETNQIQLIIPAYSLTEPFDTLIRQAKRRRDLHTKLNDELKQLSRSISYTESVDNIKTTINQLLIQSNEEQRNRFKTYQDELLNISEIIPLNTNILSKTYDNEQQYSLSSQDAIVYSSIIAHLSASPPSSACFLNRNSKDFGNSDIVAALKQLNCQILFSFAQGYNYIKSQI